MKSERPDTFKTFATFRVAGDQLAPDQITKILNILPTYAYRKGERYSAGDRSNDLRGRTGVWYFSTNKLVPSTSLDDHIAFIVRLLIAPSGDYRPLAELRQLIDRRSLEAHVTCFWRGTAGSKKPVLHPVVTELFNLVPADIELDLEVSRRNGRRPTEAGG